MPDSNENKNVHTLEVEATAENLLAVQALVEEQLEAMDCPMKVVTQIDIVVEEVYINIVHYAYGQKVGKAVVSVETLQTPKMIKITFMDWGIPYNPLEKKDPDVTLTAQDRSIGGLGIYMTKKLMDDVSYEYRDGQNVLTISKALDA